MTDAELVALAVEMRAAQNAYYRDGRSRENYRRAIGLERAFDREVARRAAESRPAEPCLFDGVPDRA